MSDNLLLEVDEAMRWERLEKLWKNHGNHILAAILFIILATAAYSGYNAWNDHVKINNTEQLMSLLQDSAFPDNITPETLKLHGPLRGTILIQGAAAYLKQNKAKESLALLEQASADRSGPADIRDLATLMRARLLANQKAADADLKNLQRDLEAVTDNNNSPWRAYAALEAASLAANIDHDYPKARGFLATVIDDKDAIPSLRAKAQAMSQLYAAAEPSKETP